MNPFQLVELSPAAEKIMKKFSKRISKEAAAEKKEFDMRIGSEQHWYVQWTVDHGLYAGQKHTLEIKLVYGREPDLYIYPASPPLVTFLTSIWHPNISATGTVCLDSIKENWSPVMNIENVVKCVQSLLDDPNPLSPQNNEAALDFQGAAPDLGKKVNEFYTDAGVPREVADLFRLG